MTLFMERQYRAVMASDLKRDGMALELVDASGGETVAEVFYSDATGRMTLTTFRRDLPLEAALTLERQAFQLLFDTDDKREGMTAFLEKRAPRFTGR